MEFSTSGPAFTLKVKHLQSDINFDMDLVPAFPFSDEHWVSTRQVPMHIKRPVWHAVPKPWREQSNGSNQNNCAFITSYVILERDIIKDCNNLKTLIRIFKKMRDTMNLKHLKSYYIKTVFLHHNEEKKMIRGYWDKPLDILFKEVRSENAIISDNIIISKLTCISDVYKNYRSC